MSGFDVWVSTAMTDRIPPSNQLSAARQRFYGLLTFAGEFFRWDSPSHLDSRLPPNVERYGSRYVVKATNPVHRTGRPSGRER